MFKYLVLEYANKHPDYVLPNNIVANDYYPVWLDICEEFNKKVVELSGGSLYHHLGTVKGENGQVYLNCKGDCNYRSWNKGYLEKFEEFNGYSMMVPAPLVFDSPEEYWAFVVKVRRTICE